MSGADFIVAEYSVPAAQAPGVDFKVTLDGDGEYQCNCWEEGGACEHIAEVAAGFWHSDDPLVRAVDLNRRERSRDHE